MKREMACSSIDGGK